MGWVTVLAIYTMGCIISHLLEEKYPSSEILGTNQEITPDMIKVIMYFRIILWPFVVVMFVFGAILGMFSLIKD